MVVPAASSESGQLQGSRAIQALVLDRQPLFVAALGSLLRTSPLVAQVLTSFTSDRALEIARSTEVDLVCSELHSEPMSGVELARVLGAERPEIPVILLGDVGDEAQLAAALSTNVAGLFTKNAAPDEFLSGVRAVLSGHRAIGSGVIGEILERLASPHSPGTRRFGNQLSPTELEILAMVGQAQSIPAIAASRGISHKTVRNHLAKIYRKLELHGRTEAMLWATRMGLTST